MIETKKDSPWGLVFIVLLLTGVFVQYHFVEKPELERIENEKRLEREMRCLSETQRPCGAHAPEQTSNRGGEKH